jgi:hypothetical protein
VAEVIKFGMKLTGVPETRRALSKARYAGYKAFEEVIVQVVDLIHSNAQMYAPALTGDMRRSIIKKLEPTDEGWTAVIEAQGGLIYVEYGTGLRAQQSSANGQIKNPIDIAHTSKGQWYIPVSKIGESQAQLLEEYYGMLRLSTPDGDFIICHGQAPQPFMYPASQDGRRALETESRGWFSFAFAKYNK